MWIVSTGQIGSRLREMGRDLDEPRRRSGLHRGGHLISEGLRHFRQTGRVLLVDRVVEGAVAYRSFDGNAFGHTPAIAVAHQIANDGSRACRGCEDISAEDWEIVA